MGEEGRTSVRMATAIVGALIAAVVVFALLYPFSRVDTNPVQCLSVVGYGVPCGESWATAGAALTAGILGLLIWLRNRGTVGTN